VIDAASPLACGRQFPLTGAARIERASDGARGDECLPGRFPRVSSA
jgi:hypothetical protein